MVLVALLMSTVSPLDFPAELLTTTTINTTHSPSETDNHRSLHPASLLAPPKLKRCIELQRRGVTPVTTPES